MSILIDVRRLQDARRLANVVAALNPYQSFNAVPSALGAFAGGPFAYQVFPRNPPGPSFLWMDTGDQVVVAASGILTAADGLSVFTSTLQPLVVQGSWAASDAVVAAGRAIFSQLGSTFARGPRSWVVVGHSYGGSAGCALAGLLFNAGVVADLQLLSFGAPRPGDVTLRDLLARYTVRRFMGEDDPVPKFPPHLLEAPALNLAAGPAISVQWSRYVQPQGGVVITSDGTMIALSLPPSTLPITDIDLGGWVLSDRGFFSTGHKIQTYLARLDLALSRAATIDPNPLVGSPPESPSAQVLAQFQAAATGAAPVLSPTGGLPMSQGYIPPQFRAVAFKAMPNDYRVRWMGFTVLTALNRSNARSLARGINGWLRRMQGAKSADHTAFNAALAAYWLVAPSSSQGFNPPLNVT